MITYSFFSMLISIHALAGRATSFVVVNVALTIISIHALAGRATAGCCADVGGTGNFNPRPRGEGDLLEVIDMMCGVTISIHALAGRATASSHKNYLPNAYSLGNMLTNMHIIGRYGRTPVYFHLFCPYFLVRTSQCFYVRIGFASRRSVVHLLVCHARLRNVPLYSYSDFLRNKNEHCLSLDSFL